LVPHAHFPPSSKTGIAANSVVNPAIIKMSMFRVGTILPSKTLSDLKHNGGQTHFTGEIWQHSAAIDWLPLVQTTQLVWIDVNTKTHSTVF
jgi:hypothetical protein